MSDIRISRALLSCYDKTGLVEFGKGLAELGSALISTGGTFRALKQAGIDVMAVEDVTGFPEMMDGRVKTLHPRIHGGILANRDVPSHMAALKEHNIEPIDLVCVNLYPFVKVTSDPACTFEDAIENIDIGGPTMVRSSAKNHKDVVIVTRPDQYDEILGQLRANDGRVDGPTRLKLAQAAFAATADYDTHIRKYLAGKM